MKVVTLTSEEVVWNVTASRAPMKSKDVCRSQLQYEIGELLQRRFPYDTILEDITIPRSKLSLDFFIPQRRIAIEVQGSQHFNQNSFFHETKTDFFRQQERDLQKAKFCSLNRITLYTFSSLEEAQAMFKTT